MVIDGGRGQLRCGHRILERVAASAGLSIDRLRVVSLAKQHGADGRPSACSSAGPEGPRPITPAARELRLLVRLRDEPTAVANRARVKRQREGLSSRLSEVPGLGPKRVTALLPRLRSVERGAAATPEELTKAGHFSLALAQEDPEFLNA
jgi:excinuclease ABC subunit C